MHLDESIRTGIEHGLAIVGGTWIVLQVVFNRSAVRVTTRRQKERELLQQEMLMQQLEQRPQGEIAPDEERRGVLQTGAECFLEIHRVCPEEAQNARVSLLV